MRFWLFYAIISGLSMYMDLQNIQILAPVAEKSEKGRFPREFVLKLAKTVVFGLIGFSVVFANFALENSVFGKADALGDQKISSFNYDTANVFPENYSFKFDQSSNPKMSVLNRSLFRLESGRVWGNFAISPDRVNVFAGSTVIIPDLAEFDLNFDGKQAVLKVYSGRVYVGFLEDLGEDVVLFDEYNPLFINRLLVDAGEKAIIPMGKITDRLQTLLPSKIVKEFKVVDLQDTDFNEQFASENLKADSTFLENARQNFISELNYRGARTDDGLIGRSVFWAEENLAFVPAKKDAVLFDHVFTYLDNALYFAGKNQADAMQKNLNAFKQALYTVSGELEDRYDPYLRKSLLFGPESSQSEVFGLLFDQVGGEAALNLRRQNLQKALKLNPVEAQSALDIYYQNLDRMFGGFADKEVYLKFISDQNQMFNGLLEREVVFYKDAYFAMKNAIEQELLKQYAESQVREEVSQDLISEKIVLIKHLQKFFFEEKVVVDDAREILTRLLREVDDLMPADNHSVAVIELFQNQLSDIDDFWGYLNSPEYNSSKTYGLTHAERYKSYLSDRDKIWSFINIQKDVLGEEVEADVSKEDVVKAIKDVFAQIPDYGDVSVGEIKDLSQRYVEISAVVGGYNFKATYDRDNQIVKDVYAYDKLVSDRPIKLESVLTLIQAQFANLVGENGAATPEELGQETNAERTLKRYLANLFVEAGFTATEDNVMIVDKDNAIYRLDGIFLSEYKNALATVDYSANREKVSNVFITVNGEPLVMDGEYTLEELKSVVAAKARIEKDGKVLR